MDVRRKLQGFSLLELMITLVIAAMLVSVALPMYDRNVQRGKAAKAIGDISRLSLEIERYRLNNRDQMPPSLSDLSIAVPEDPWGQPYIFLNIIDGDAKIGDLRKDGKLNPLNSDFDLYSIGRDGETAKPLNAKSSRDDIVRANDGAFIGLGADY